MNTKKIKKMKMAWKYRKFLWKYRAIIRHRREIMGVLAVSAIAAGILIRRPSIESISAERG
jgi:hypothetical protein